MQSTDTLRRILGPEIPQHTLSKKTAWTASPSAGKWSSPPTTGPRPPPSVFFTFTAINKKQAVMFGGLQPGRGRVSDVYIIDFSSTV